MGLEAGTYINSLVATNPVGAVDPKSQGDDHLRLLKSTIKATFPNLTGAVGATQTQLNYLGSATGVTGTVSSNVVMSASPTITGTLTAATVAATTLTGAGSGITALNASNLASGTVPDARFPSTLPALSGVNLTALNASNLASGSVADARLGNAALKNADNTFTSSGNSTQLIQTTAASGNLVRLQFATDSTVRAQVGVPLNAGSFFTSGTANALVLRSESVGIELGIGSAIYLRLDGSGNFNFFGGTVTTSNASASEVGFKGLPANTQNAGYTCVLTDAGKHILLNTAGTFTIPANSSVAYPVGTVLTFANGTTACTIAITSDTMTLAGTSSTGSRTLAVAGIATALKITATAWLISGPGVS